MNIENLKVYTHPELVSKINEVSWIFYLNHLYVLNTDDQSVYYRLLKDGKVVKLRTNNIPFDGYFEKCSPAPKSLLNALKKALDE